MSEITILGAGMAGSGAVHRLHQEGASSVLFEKQPYFGGHTATYTYEGGWTFDDGPHISFTKSERLQDLYAGNVGGEYEVIHAQVNNYWRGQWVKHPAQANLHGLPVPMVIEIIKEFFELSAAEKPEIRNYADWLYASYGRTFAENFPMEYTRKYHTIDAANMSTDWLGPRMYKPDLDELLRGALEPKTPDVHYIDNFRYPTHGGFVQYISPYAQLTDLHLDHEVTGIDPKARQLRFANGQTHTYEQLVTSVPLPALVPMIDRAPADVVEASARLACTTCVLVNIGLDRADISTAHWTYFYDEDIFFTRLSFPHMMSPNNVPPGAGSIQCEVYWSDKYRPLDRPVADCIEPVITDLRRCGYIREDDRILHSNATLAPYANVIFDLERAASLETVHGFLREEGIHYCGRYGDWGYMWTDESFESGEGAAQRALDAAG